MLERFLGKSEKSALPKNQIEVICPLCGSHQLEPRLVVTTFCRKCGEHLRMEKGGRVLASARVNPVPSSVYPAVSDDAPGAESIREDEAGTGRATPGGAPESAPTRSGRDAEPATAAVPPTASQGMLGRMRDAGGSRQHYFKEVECFECHGRFKVGRSSRSTHCPTCGVLLCLEDVDLDGASTSPIRTRGDVFIRKSGNVQTTEVRCRDLKLFGALSASIECSGEFFVRSSATVVGEVRCRRLVIDKGCDARFVNNILADEVEVGGRILGSIQCSGLVNISATGWVQGDVTARAVAIEPGGQLDGTMNIVRPSAAARAAGAVVVGKDSRSVPSSISGVAWPAELRA